MILPPLLACILLGGLIYYDNTQEKPTDKYKYIVIYDDGYRTTYSHTDMVKDTCIATMQGKVCGTFYLKENCRYKGK